jgi:hypothetical protein
MNFELESVDLNNKIAKTGAMENKEKEKHP